MNNKFKPNTDERPIMIVIGIITLYILIAGFISYLYCLHRIQFIPAIISIGIFTAIYLPRLLIINKLKNKDSIKINENSITINKQTILFDQIKDFRVQKKKPQVVFFMNNSMVVFQEAEFHILLNNNYQVDFTAIGTEKINLLTEFLKTLKGY